MGNRTNILKEDVDFLSVTHGKYFGLFGGDKFKLLKDLTVKVGIVGLEVETNYCKLERNGQLKILAGFEWNGASGPTFDTKTTYRASCVHDCLYVLLEQNLLPTVSRKKVDRQLYEIMRDDGANWTRSKCWLFAVNLAGKFWINKD